jgi:hypothetical protein
MAIKKLKVALSEAANTADGINASAFITVKYRGITALRTIDATDYLINCTANTFTVTLPTAASVGGRTYVVKNSGTGVITIACNGAETIDGIATHTLAQYDSLTLVSNGTNWIII